MEFLNAPHHLHGGWRVSNSAFIALSVVVVVLTWTLLIVAYPSLPARIPQHFGLSGVPDAMGNRTWWAVFFPGILQVLLTALTWWLSHHPEYSNLPSTLSLRAIPEPAQTKIKRVLAHLIVMTGVIANLVFAYIALAVVRVGLGQDERLNSWAIFGLVIFLILLVVVYSVWIARLTRTAVSRSDASV